MKFIVLMAVLTLLVRKWDCGSSRHTVLALKYNIWCQQLF